MKTNPNLTPPKAAKKEKILEKHGDKRLDPYYWLNERENPEVIEYLEAENAYREQMMGHLKNFEEDLFQEIIGRIKQTDMSVPYLDNDYWYYVRYEEGKEYPIYARKKESLDNEEEVLLDVNVLAEPHPYYQVSGLSVSPDNTWLAFGEDVVSRRLYTIRFKNLETGEIREEAIPNTSGKAVWANDNQTIFYASKDPETLRSSSIFKHRLGTSVEEDELVWHETDETFSTYVFKTKSREFIAILSFQTLSTEFQVLPADDPDGQFELFHPRERQHEYFIGHFEDQWYIRTNWKAQNFRLMKTPVGKMRRENWEEVIPHRPDILLEDMELFRDFLVLSERLQGITNLRVMPWEGEEHYIDFHEEAYLAYTSVNLEFDTDLLRIGYTSMTTPNSIYDYHMKTREMTLLKQQEVIGDFDPANYESERLYAQARDGVEVPISLVYRKGFERDGQAPLLLYAYGSYGHSMDPYFSSVRLSLLDRGFVFALAHIRGGEEMGRQWYENGKLLKKKNTFTDFIDCAKHLAKQKYTSPEHLFAMGGSAGGLLMGAVVNMRPDLFRGVVAAVPFVDVVTTMLDDSIPLTTGEYDEWGNPNVAQYYWYIKSYSPYDNVKAQEYPAMLVTTGLHDSQVQYWEPAKWVARLREWKTDDHPLLLHTNMEAGHGGASGRFRQFRETAMEYAFLLDLAGKV